MRIQKEIHVIDYVRHLFSIVTYSVKNARVFRVFYTLRLNFLRKKRRQALLSYFIRLFAGLQYIRSRIVEDLCSREGREMRESESMKSVIGYPFLLWSIDPS